MNDDGFFKILKSAIDKGLIKNMVKPIRLISHRANLDGIDLNRENKIWAIEECLKRGYLVEVDLWIENYEDEYGCPGQRFYLSHDQPKYSDIIEEEWLLNNQDYLLIHCKNKDAVQYAMTFLDGEWFAHDQDRWAGTSCSHLICYGKEEDIIDDDRVILMMPEHHNIKKWPKSIYGICTDFVKNYEYLLA